MSRKLRTSNLIQITLRFCEVLRVRMIEKVIKTDIIGWILIAVVSGFLRNSFFSVRLLIQSWWYNYSLHIAWDLGCIHMHHFIDFPY